MKKLFFILALLCTPVFCPNIALSTEPWPGEPWQESINLTSLDADFQNNLSGAHWNENTQTLWVCLNGPGKFWALVPDGLGGFEIDTQNGRVAEWSVAGDFEGITQVNLDEPYVYLMAEGEDNIKKFDVSVYGVPVLVRSWNISQYVPTSGGSGSEGIAFVPDDWLRLNGFVDRNGAPYTSQNGMGGLMFVAHQNGGSIYAFDLDPDSNAVTFVGAYKTLRAESSGLEFDRSSGKLYIWHNTGANFIEITDLTSSIAANGVRYFSSVREYQGPKSGNLEGIALTPASSENSWYFATDDDNQNGAALMWFNSFDPEVLGNDQYKTYQNTSLEVDSPGVIENDLGVSELELIQGPNHGSLDLNTQDGSFVYQPDEGFVGVDSFMYSSVGFNETAKVEITVKPVYELTKSVLTSMDDVEERANGSIYTNSTDLELVQDNTLQTVGVRFTNLGIPKGAKIVSASIQFTTDEVSRDLTQLTIQGDASGAGRAFGLSSFDISSRARTSASIAWSPDSWDVINEAGPRQQTPDMASIVQEMIDADSWQEGSAMAFIITGQGKRVARSFDQSPALAPRLIIKYSNDTPIPAEPEINSVDIRVSSDVDDVEQRSDGTMYLNSTDLELVTDGLVQTVGIRFRSVAIPQGAEITNASIQFTVDETSNEPTQLVIHGEAASDAAQFTTTARDLTDRVQTNAFAEWAPLAWNTIGASGDDQKTPDLSAIVQEVVDNPNWQSNGSLVFMVSGSGRRTAESFAGSPNQAPLLHIEYR